MSYHFGTTSGHIEFPHITNQSSDPYYTEHGIATPIIRTLLYRTWNCHTLPTNHQTPIIQNMELPHITNQSSEPYYTEHGIATHH